MKSQNLLQSIHVPSKHWYCTLLHWAAKGNHRIYCGQYMSHRNTDTVHCCTGLQKEITEFTAVNTCPIETLVLYIAALGCKRKSQNLLRSIHVPSKHWYCTLLHGLLIKSQNLLRSIHVPSKHWYCSLLHWAAKGNHRIYYGHYMSHRNIGTVHCCTGLQKEITEFTAVNTCPIETLVLYIAAWAVNKITEFTAVNTCPIETLVLYIAALGCK